MIDQKDIDIYPAVRDLTISSFHNVNCRMHLNSGFEIVVVVDGTLNMTVNNTAYEIHKNEGIIVLPFESHSFVSNATNKSYVCLFPTRIDPSFPSLSAPQCRVIQMDDDSVAMLLKHTCNSLTAYYGIEAKAIIYTLLTDFIKKSDFATGKKKDNPLFLKALDFINNNFLQGINTEDVAKELNITPASLSRIFKNASGIKPTQYFSIIRCDYAKKLLTSTNLSITEIALNSGFSTIRNFNIAFRKSFGVTPSECRNNPF